jgi:hypothetical protein
MICSELVNHVLLATGYITPAEKVEDLTPNQLFNFLKNLCQVRATCREEFLHTL